MAPDRYVLGSSDAEIERLRLQHALWLPSARAAWQRAGLQPGQASPAWSWRGWWGPAGGCSAWS